MSPQLSAKIPAANNKPVTRLSLQEYSRHPRFAQRREVTRGTNTNAHEKLDTTDHGVTALRRPLQQPRNYPVATRPRLVFPTGPDACTALAEPSSLKAEVNHQGNSKYTNFELERKSVQIICRDQIALLGDTRTPENIRQVAIRVLIKHKAEITSFGKLPYDTIKPVLKTIDSARQLKTIEENSPHICKEDEFLWQKLIARDFGTDALSKLKVGKETSWSALYDKCRQEQDREKDRVALSMKRVMEATEAARKTTTTMISGPSGQPSRRGRGTEEGWGARNNWDAKVGSKVKDIVRKSKIEAHQVALRNQSAEGPVVRSQIDPEMANALRMRHQRRQALTTTPSKKRSRPEDAHARVAVDKKARTTDPQVVAQRKNPDRL